MQLSQMLRGDVAQRRAELSRQMDQVAFQVQEAYERVVESEKVVKLYESKAIPAHFDYAAVPQLRAEAREKLSRVRPASLGQASRISGITPADLAVVLYYLG